MSLTNQLSSGPASRSIPATLVMPDGAQRANPYLWAGGVWPISTTTPGTDTTPTAGTTYYGSIFIPHRMVLTGATNLIGSVGGTDTVIYYLFSPTGAVLGYTTLSGTTVGTAATLQTRLAFIDPITVDGPGLYFVGLTVSGNTCRVRTHAIGNHPTGSQAGTHATPAAISSVPTTFTANVCPVIGVY